MPLLSLQLVYLVYGFPIIVFKFLLKDTANIHPLVELFRGNRGELSVSLSSLVALERELITRTDVNILPENKNFPA